jgi:type VI secretion system protein ImpH
MDATMGREADAVAFLDALAAAPYRYDFYQTLRVLECLHAGQPRWGTALRPADEPIRLGQVADLSFAPTSIASFEPGGDRIKPHLSVYFAGLLGPNGPLPLHMTEYARERLRNAGDRTLGRFLDIFHHRFLAFLYRAWAQAQPHVNRDRPASDRFAVYVGSFPGIAPASFQHRDDVPDTAKFFHVSTLARQVRHAEGLAAILRQFFDVPVVVEEFVGHWLRLEQCDRALLGRTAAVLGVEAVLGSRVWDRQHKFRLRLGPLTWAQYESFLPGHGPLRKLVDWVRLYLCFELAWDVRLVLARREVPPLKLGGGARLGWTAWLGTRPRERDGDDLCLNAEALVELASLAGARHEVPPGTAGANAA